jgi:hypothetical protein
VLPLVGATALLSAAALGQVRGAGPYIGVDEIHPGMRGYGLTVFRGTSPERFDVEVIDVLHNFRPDQDLILVRTTHPILERALVVGGMSGSPVYFEGRLAGAYAYGWPYASEPVAGVTPIRNMVTELRRPVRATPFPAGPLPTRSDARATREEPGTSARLAGLPPYLGGPVDASTALRAHAAQLGLDRAGSGSATDLRPATTPLLVGGLDERTVAMLNAQLEGFGLVALQAGGGGQAQPSAGAPASYENGGAVAVQLARGDVSLNAIGTVTLVDGRRVAAFGHPMMNAGETALPTAVARVLHVLASVARSFKIGEPVRTVGSLVHDRQSAIVLDTETEAATVPVRVRVLGVPGAPRTEWNTEIASHRVLTPTLVNAVITNALGATVADTSDAMFEATSRVWIAGRARPLEVVDRGFSRAGPANPLALSQIRLFPILEAVYGNPFEDARVERVEIDLAVRFERPTVRIVDASVSAREVDPGSTVPVRVVLRRWNDDEEVRVVPVRIPERLAGESVELTVEGGASVDVQVPQPRDLDELLATVHRRYAQTSMVVSVETPQRGLRVAGHVVDHLPRSALDALQLRNDGDRNRPFVTFDRQEIALGEIVSGNARVELGVRRAPRP